MSQNWERQREECKAKISQDSARDIADAIDELIEIRIEQLHEGEEYRRDEIEMLKRKITDYLLVTDPRHGVFFQP